MPRILLAVAIILALMMSGCKISGSKANNSQGSLRLVHLDANTGAVDMKVSDASQTGDIATTTCVPGSSNNCDIANLNFQQISGYNNYDSGSADFFSVFLADGSAILGTNIYTLNADTDYTLILYGSSGTPFLLLVSDTTINTPASNTFEFRPIHTAIASGSLDFYLVPAASVNTSTGVANIATAAANFGGFGLTGIPLFLQFTPGSYVMVITASGSKTPLYQSSAFTFANGDIVSADIYTSGSGSLLNVALMYQDNSNGGGSNKNTFNLAPNLYSQFKVVNASPSVGTINVTADETGFTTAPTLFSNVPFGSISSYSSVFPTVNGNINFIATANNGVAATVPESKIAGVGNSGVTPVIPPQGGTDYSVVLVDYPTRMAVVLTDNNLPPPVGDTKIRFVNAINSANAIDVQANFAAVATNILVNTQSPYVNFVSGKFPATITANVHGVAGTIATITGLDILLVNGATYTVYFVGNPGSTQAIITRDQ